MTLTFVILVVAAVVLGALIVKRGSPTQQKETTEEASDWTMFDWVNQSGEKNHSPVQRQEAGRCLRWF